MEDDHANDTPAEQSAFNQDQPPHVGADDDPDRSQDLTTEDLGEGGPAGG